MAKSSRREPIQTRVSNIYKYQLSSPTVWAVAQSVPKSTGK